MEALRRIVVGITVVVTVSVMGPADAAPSVRAAGAFFYVTESRPAAARARTAGGATCPTGSRVTGGGMSTDRTWGVRFAAAVPFDDGDTINDPDEDRDDGFYAQLFNGDPGDGTLTVTAICLRTADRDSLTYPSQRSSTSATSFYGRCGQGQLMLGGGTAAATFRDDVWLTSTRPFADPGTVPTWYSTFISNANSDMTYDHVLSCLGNSGRAVRVVQTSVAVDHGQRGSAKATCPARMHASGGGIYTAGSGSPFVRSLPFDGPDKDRTPDDGWITTMVNRTADPQVLAAYVVCVR